HILLGLLREGDGVAARVLKNLDVDIEQARLEILRELDPNFTGEETNPKHDAPKPQPVQTYKRQLDPIDTAKRYDIYCSEQKERVVVYGNALFIDRRHLLPSREGDYLAEHFELEQSDGTSVFIPRFLVLKFCEPGVTPSAQDVSGNITRAEPGANPPTPPSG